MKLLRLLALTVLVSLAVFGPAYGQTNPTPIDTTHYWTYKLVQPEFRPSEVLARDQFLTFDTPVYLDSLTRLVNWVIKNESAVRDTFIHYTWWNIRNKLPVAKHVQVTNQFGSFPVDVQNLEFLLVPAWKNQPQPVPPYANHYLCYRAIGFPPPALSVHLRDEWRNDFQNPGPLEFLCVPCWKNHNGQIFAPVDTVNHLALYPITPVSELFYPFVQDQFREGPTPVRQTPIEYLLVPSLKREEPTKTQNTTWGKVKVLYR
jgi:hypothetical protein